MSHAVCVRLESPAAPLLTLSKVSSVVGLQWTNDRAISLPASVHTRFRPAEEPAGVCRSSGRQHGRDRIGRDTGAGHGDIDCNRVFFQVPSMCWLASPFENASQWLPCMLAPCVPGQGWRRSRLWPRCRRRSYTGRPRRSTGPASSLAESFPVLEDRSHIGPFLP